MPSDFLAVEFICLILALRRIHISSSIGCRRLDKLDRKQSNVTYVERRKMSLDDVRRQSDARCPPIWGSRPVLTSSRDSTTSPLGRSISPASATFGCPKMQVKGTEPSYSARKSPDFRIGKRFFSSSAPVQAPS